MTKRKSSLQIVAVAFLAAAVLAQNPFPTDQLPAASAGDVIEEEPNGPIDFSQAEEQPDGSLCVVKTKYVEKLEKTQIKECWHQNVTACHETYVTEFKPNQEQVRILQL